MRAALFAIFCLFLGVVLYGQKERQPDYWGEAKDLLGEAEKVVFNNPEQAIKISEYVLLSTVGFSEKSNAGLLKATGFYVKGNYSQALQAVLDAKRTIEIHGGQKAEVYWFLTLLFQRFGPEVLAERNLAKMEQILSKTDDKRLRNELLANINYYYSKEFSEMGSTENALEKVYRSKQYSNQSKTKDKRSIAPLAIGLGKIHLKRAQLDSAQYYLETALETSKGNLPNNYLKMLALSNLGKLFFHRKENRKSLSFLSRALHLAEQFENVFQQKSLLDQIAANYLVLGNRKEFFHNTKKAASLSEKIQNQENNVLNIAYNYVDSAQNEQYASVKKTNIEKTYLLSAVLLLVIMGGTLILFREHARDKQYAKLLTYMKSSLQKTNQPNLKRAKSEKKPLVPKETETYLLKKLERFEKSGRFLRKDMSLAKLSAHFETNTKYLSEVINYHKNRNFNSYINELRIDYIIKKLKDEPRYSNYKISYLAEESGFSSHSSFATIFKSVTGASPKVFIEFLKKEKDKQVGNPDQL